jgi:hypothetical protein
LIEKLEFLPEGIGGSVPGGVAGAGKHFGFIWTIGYRRVDREWKILEWGGGAEDVGVWKRWEFGIELGVMGVEEGEWEVCGRRRIGRTDARTLRAEKAGKGVDGVRSGHKNIWNGEFLEGFGG